MIIKSALFPAKEGRMFQNISYQVDGRSFEGVLAAPTTSPPRGGVLFFHGGSGPGDHERDRVRRLAEAGYVAFAPDLFGEVFADRTRGMAVIGELVGTPARLRARVGAAWRRLTDCEGVAGRTAAVGHCFGGLAALELARSGADVRAVASFHGGLAAREPARRGEVRARILVCTGADDPFCPREQRTAFEDEMTVAGADWQMHVHGGARHGFSIPAIDPTRHPGCAYHEPSDRRSGQAMLELLEEALPRA
jgi:dienelactone hydrolase